MDTWSGQRPLAGVLAHAAATDPALRELRLVFWLLLASGCWVVVSRAEPPVPAWVATAVSGVAWLRVDQSREGRILWTITPTHGVTEADLLVPLVVCGAASLRGLRQFFAGRRRDSPA